MGGGQAPLQARVAGQRPPAAEHQLVAAALVAIGALAWAYQLHAVVAGAQAIAQLAKGIGHSVDFRGEGFGNKCDMKGCGHDPSVGWGHDVNVSR
jgi:predicted metal-binding membrane protein